MPSLKKLSMMLLMTCTPVLADTTPNPSALYDHEMRKLHSTEVVNLRDAYAGHPLLLVNTASRCGFTGQFEGLEALHQEYRSKGLKIAGFASNSFRQEASDEEAAAQVCFINFGVTFDMFAPISVRGTDAHPVFHELARQSQAPRWNFYKYLIDREGRVTAVFPSTTKPDSADIKAAIEQLL